MNLYKRGKRYWLKFMRNGQMNYLSTGTSNKSQAQKFMNDMIMATRAPTFEKAVAFLRLWYDAGDAKEGMPLDEAWERYVEIAKSTGRDAVADQTWRMRRERVATLVAWASEQGAKFVEDVDGPTAAAYAAHISTKGLKSKTRKNILGELSIVWKMLEKVSANIRNPWSGLSPRDTDGTRLNSFTDEQAAAVLKAAKRIGKDWFLACLIAFRTGLRYGDVATLKWDCVDFKQGLIHTVPRKTKKHLISVTLPIAADLLDELKRQYANRADGNVLPLHFRLYGKKGKAVKRVLSFREVLAAAGIGGEEDGYTFHSWRHTFRTKLAAAGVPTETAMRLCGHTDAQTSARYDHDEHLDELRAAVDAASRR